MSESTVRLVFTSQSGDAVRGVRQIEGAFSSLEKTGARAARAIGTVAFGAIAAGIGISIKSAVDFDKAMRNVNSIARVSETQFKGLEKSVLGLARSSGQAPKVLAAGLYDIVSSGFKASDALIILGASAKAARAGMTDTATSTKGVVAVLNAYHLKASDAATVSDQLFQTVNLGVITFGELASQIGDVLPFASTLKIGLDQVGASIATLTKEGVSGAEAVTRIKSVMSDFISPNKALTAAIKDQGFASGAAMVKALGFQGSLDQLVKSTGGNVTETGKLFTNIRALGGVLGLTGANTRGATADLKGLEASAGSTGRAFSEQSKSISAQWQKFTAFVTTGAIELGTRAFPILAAAIATGSSGFDALKTVVERNMPAIERAVHTAIDTIKQILPAALEDGKRLFAELEPIAVKVFDAIVSAAETVGPILGGIAGFVGDLASALGAAPILGAAATFWAISGAVEAIAGALAALAASGGIVALISNPLFLIPAAAAVAVGALIALGGSFDTLADKARNAADALINYDDSLNAARGSHLATERAIVNVGKAQVAYTAAVKESAATQAAYDKAVAGGHATHAQTKKLADAAAAAKAREKDASLNLRDADLRLAEAKGREAAAGKKMAEEGKALEESLGQQIDKAVLMNTALLGVARAGTAQKKSALDQKKAVADLAQSFYDTAISAKGLTAQQRTADLAISKFILTTGRIPTKKELKVIVDGVLGGIIDAKNLKAAIDRLHDKDINLTVRTTTLGGAHHRAMGGFIPGPPGAGDTVPALLTPGEVVLNDRQQNMLGKGKIMSVLKATGGVVGGSRFARGGIATAGEHLSQRLTGSVARIVAAIKGTQLAESDNDRSYGQMNREFDITQEQFIVTDADGNESLDQTAVNQRLGELAALENKKRGMLALLDRETTQLNAAVDTLKASIDRLNPIIRRARTQAQKDAREVASIERQLSQERAKKHPNKARVQALESRKKSVSKRQHTLEGDVTDWTGLVGDWRSLIGDEQLRLHDVPFDKRDTQIDLEELDAEIAGVRAVRPAAPTSSGGGALSPGTGESVATLEALVAQLRQALTVGDVQSAIIGSFQAGTINVPETGLALVHAGETIIPDAQSARVPSGGGGPMQVTVVLQGDVFDDKAQAWIEGQYGSIVQVVNRRLGDKADGLRRSGAVR